MLRQRKQLFVDSKVQGALVLRAVGYWFFCLLTMALALLLWRLFTGPARLFYTHFDDMWYWYGPAAISSLLVLPLVLIDSIRMSNRFAGPLFRLRREMRRLAAGEKVQPVHFREGDFWQDFAEEFNAVARRIDVLAQRAGSASITPEKADRSTVKDNSKPPQLEAGGRTDAAPIAVALDEDELYEVPGASR